MIIKDGDFKDPLVIDLLNVHLTGMQENSPADSVFALDLSALQTPDIRFWVAWQDSEALGCGALKAVSNIHGEVKSMRTHQRHLRKGVAANILEYIVEVAKQRQYRRLSLETGSGSSFDAALSLYRKYGFVNGPAFGGYAASEFNQFLHLDL